MALDPPKVFISYSHDSPEHRQRVLAFSERLRTDGLDSQLDQYVCGTPEVDWPRWMLNQLDWADFVLLVCTESYYRRFRGRGQPDIGKGVDWEGQLITLEIYNSKSRVTKFVPVIFDSSDREFVPEPLRGRTHYLLSSEGDYGKLYDFLTGQAGIVPGELGPLNTQRREAVEPLRFAPNHTYTPGAPVEIQDPSPFQTAGMLEEGHRTYVPRECDRELEKFLDDPKTVCIAINGDYEIGKSSLMMRARTMLGEEWIAVGAGLGDLRSDKPALCVDNFFKLFAPHFGQLGSWRDLVQHIVDQPVLLRLDDLGEMQEAGAKAILPRVIEAALAASGKLRVVATLPVGIEEYLTDCGLGNPKYHRPWRTLTVRPFRELQAKSLLSLLPGEPLLVVKQLFVEVERCSELKPRPLQCLANRLWHAHLDREQRTRLAAIVRNPESYKS